MLNSCFLKKEDCPRTIYIYFTVYLYTFDNQDKQIKITLKYLINWLI